MKSEVTMGSFNIAKKGLFINNLLKLARIITANFKFSWWAPKTTSVKTPVELFNEDPVI